MDCDTLLINDNIYLIVCVAKGCKLDTIDKRSMFLTVQPLSDKKTQTQGRVYPEKGIITRPSDLLFSIAHANRQSLEF